MNYAFTLDSVFKWAPPKTQNRLDKPVWFTHANVLLSYVSETIFAWKPEFPQDSCQSFYGRDNSPCASVMSKCKLFVRGLVPVSEF